MNPEGVRELRRRIAVEAALQSPAMMGRYVTGRGFALRGHTRLISDALTQVGKEGEADRLLITIPPQTGKSTLASELFPFWMLARDPSRKVGITSYSAALALKKSRAVRRMVTEHGDAFGVNLQPGDGALYDWSTTAGGGVRATGVEGSLTGFEVNGALICDDPHKDRAEADSRLKRDRAWEWWSSVALSRLRPGTPVVLLLTRWHEDDLAARVLKHEGDAAEGGRWRTVRLEAIATGAHVDPLGRAPGEPLTHPAIEDTDRAALLKHWEDKRSTSTPRDWGALYQGDPRPREGSLVSEALMAERTHLSGLPAAARIAVAVDPSGGGRDEAGIVGGYLGTDGRLYWTHDRSARMSSAQWSRAACALAYETDADRIVIERNYGGDQPKLIVRTTWDALMREGVIAEGTLPPKIVEVNAKRGKILRAEPIAQQLAEDRVRLGARLPELVGEWMHYMPGSSESPGRIDASVYLGYALLKVPGAGKLISTAVDVRRDQFRGGGGTPRRTY